MIRILTLIAALAFTFPLEAGTMARVLRIGDNATIVVSKDGKESTLRLAGIEITNATAAQELLRWTIRGAWVMYEPVTKEGVFLYRSPDALFVNRELVARGYARATLPGVEAVSHVTVIYLGESNPGEPTRAAGTRTGKRTNRRSPASPAARTAPAPSRGASRRDRGGRGY